VQSGITPGANPHEPNRLAQPDTRHPADPDRRDLDSRVGDGMDRMTYIAIINHRDRSQSNYNSIIDVLPKGYGSFDEAKAAVEYWYYQDEDGYEDGGGRPLTWDDNIATNKTRTWHHWIEVQIAGVL
jgi:hypothetical protein